MGKPYVTQAQKSVKCSKVYVMENGKTVKLKKAYAMENNKTVKVWNGGLFYYGLVTPVDGQRKVEGAASAGNYALFAGEEVDYNDGSRAVDVYDVSLTHSMAKELYYIDRHFGATTLLNYALFGKGYNYSGNYCTTSLTVYDDSLTQSNQYLGNSGRYPAAASTGRMYGTSGPAYALFAGGWDEDGNNTKVVDAVDNSFTRATASELSCAGNHNLGIKLQGVALFLDGSGILNRYPPTLTKSTLTMFDSSAVATAAAGNYALFVNEALEVKAYGSGSIVSCASLPGKAWYGKVVGTSLENCAIFYYSWSTIIFTAIYDESLTLTLDYSMNLGAECCHATSVGNYALFAGTNGQVGAYQA